jgi:hypothetical protein
LPRQVSAKRLCESGASEKIDEEAVLRICSIRVFWLKEFT